jgi:hypothetical protein
MAWFAGASVASGQNGRSLRDHVRQHGDTNILVENCPPITGLKEIVEATQLTVEGLTTAVESGLTPKDDEVYTEYEIEVIRVFRTPLAAPRSTRGQITLSPFLMDDSLTQLGRTARERVRLRRPNHGQVLLDGGAYGNVRLSSAQRRPARDHFRLF